MADLVDHGGMRERITDFELTCPCAGCAEKREIVDDLLLGPTWWLEELRDDRLTARERVEVAAELKRRGGDC